MRADQLKGHLDLLLLAIVHRRPAHGYAVIAALREESGGAFDLPEGTVYPALHRLERAGLLRSAWTDVAGRRRRVYELTGPGVAALRARDDEWREFTAGMQAVLGWSA
jgi:DNA-binding PadR family transcriptional regulator